MADTALTDFEIDWLGGVPSEDELKDSTAQANDLTARREKVLDEVVGGHIGRAKQQISDAQSVVLKQQSDSAVANFIWKKVLGRPDGKLNDLKWRASDDDITHLALTKGTQTDWDTRQDIEVDTREDVHDLKEIPEEQLRALNDSLSTILLAQERMLTSFDDDGNRLFTDEDIMAELWTPLVRAGTIPENMVPDRFSEQAHAFDGSAKLYNDKIKEFSANSHGKEGLLRGLSIAKDTLGLGVTLVSGAMSINNTLAIGDKQDALDSAEKASPGEPGFLTPAEKDGLRTEIEILNQQKAYVDLGGAIMTGGLDLTIAAVSETAKDKKDHDWLGFAEKTVVTLTKVMGAAMGPIAKSTLGMDKVANASGRSESSDEGLKKQGEETLARLNEISTIQTSVAAAVTALQIGPALFRAYQARNQKDAASIIAGLAGNIADTISGTMTAIATSVGGETGAVLKQAAAATAAAIRATAQGPAIYTAIADGKYKQAAMMMGGIAVQTVISGYSQMIHDAMRQDVEKATYDNASVAEKMFMEKEGDNTKSHIDGSTAMIKSVEQAILGMSESVLADLDNLPDVDMTSGEARAVAGKVIAKVAEEQKKKAAETLQKTFGDPKVVRDMIADFDRDTKDLEEMYLAAFPDDQVAGAPPEEAERAIAAIDRAIAQSQALRAKVEMINAVTGAGTAVLAAFVPGGGTVVAAQKVAYDIYAVCKATQLHNKWCDSMEVSFRANSAYGPAVERTMMNARIHLSQSSVKLVLDSLQLGAEIGKFFDPTGATTVASVSISMTKALTEYGYKMQKQGAIEIGWRAYKDALANPGNRKRARTALRLNSTLAKCAIAYGATIAKDPAAKEAVRISGLTPSVLINDKDVCNKLIAYLQDQMREDPNELKVQSEPGKWQPGRPKLTPQSWFETKSGALRSASPRLAPGSSKTPGIDRLLAELAGTTLWSGAESYAVARQRFEPDDADDFAALSKSVEDRRDLAKRSEATLTKLRVALSSYVPISEGSGARPHDEMAGVADALVTVVDINLKQVASDIKQAPPVPPKPSKPPNRPPPPPPGQSKPPNRPPPPPPEQSKQPNRPPPPPPKRSN